jgi:hypothetical protein
VSSPVTTRRADEPMAARGRVPDFFLVGHPKCGTTALYEILKGHREIFMPELKESWFLVPELRGDRRDEPVGRPDTLEEYLALFAQARPGQHIGEATPSYLRSHDAAERIAALRPDARIVAILREPASFLRSFHLQCLQNHTETVKDLRAALELEPSRRAGRGIPPSCSTPEVLLYSEHVRYVEQLRRYRAVFPSEQVLVVIYDDFRDDNRGTVKNVLRFLEVDDSAPIEISEANPSVRLRSRRLEELTRSLYRGQGLASSVAKGAVKALTPRRARRRALQAAQRHLVYAAPRPPDEDVMLELRRRFKPQVAALSEYLGRDLTGLWGYDSID